MANPFFTTRGCRIGLSTLLTADSESLEPTSFKLALCTKETKATLNNAAAVDKGGGEVGIPITGHSYAADMRVRIDGTTNYDAAYIVQSVTVNEIVVEATYIGETFAGTETIWETPGPKTNVLSDLQEITAGNGYTAGGEAVARNLTTGFDASVESDATDEATQQLKDVTWTAAGGTIPDTGDGTLFVVLTDNSSNVICFWELAAPVSISDGQQYKVQDAEVVFGQIVQ
jgi:hypothetical protein